MSAFDRRSFLLGGGAVLAAGGARAHSPPPGRWSSLAEMLFPASDIYAAPFLSALARSPDSGKPERSEVIVTAGGATPNALYNVTDSVTYYDPSADRWSYATPLPEPRRHIALVDHKGNLFAIGGYAHSESTKWIMRDDCWRLDALDGVWTAMPSLPGPQAEAVCVSRDHIIHFIGGRAPYGSRNFDRRDHIESGLHLAYDSRDDHWSAMATMPTSRSGAAGVLLGGAIHVIGGRSDGSDDLRVHEVYDPLADRWSTAAPLPKARSNFAAAVLGERIDGRTVNKIYAFGGAHITKNGGVFADVWSYDRHKDEWRAAAAMTQPRQGFAAVVLDDAVYIIGGASGAGDDATLNALDRFTGDGAG